MADPIRAALERWHGLVETDLLCPDNPAETDWGAVASAAAQTRAALAKAPTTDEPAVPENGDLLDFARNQEPWKTWLQPGGCLESAHLEIADLLSAVLTRWGRPAASPIPLKERPDFICGYRAGLHDGRLERETAPAPVEGEGLASDEGYESGAMWTGHPCRPTAPAEGEVGKLMQYLEQAAEGAAAMGHELDSWAIARAADLLQFHAAELAALRTRAALEPVPVAERPWEREDWLHPTGGWCWYHHGPSVVCRSRWHSIRPDVDFLAGDDGSLLPHWAIPIPQPPQGGEVEG